MHAAPSSRRLEDRTGFLVDGNNVFGSRPDGWWRDRAAAARRLVTELGAHPSPELLTVVFDGPRQDAVAEEAARQGIEVRFAPGGRDAADDEIVAMVASAAGPPRPRVVTSDRRLRERVIALGATVVAPRSFLEELGTPRSERLDTDRAGRVPVVSVELSLPPAHGSPPPGRLTGVLAGLSDLGVDGIWVRGPASGHLAVLGVLAAATSAPRLGPVITVPGPPAAAVLAKNLTTLDVLSSGRAQLAFEPGPGHGAGRTTAGRGGQWDLLWESLVVCRLMFRNERASFAGQHVAIRDAVNLPIPVTGDGPPIVVTWGPGDEEAIGRGAARTLRALRTSSNGGGPAAGEEASALLPDGILVDDLAAVPAVRAAAQRLAAAVDVDGPLPSILWRQRASDVDPGAELHRARASGVAAVVWRVGPDDDLAALGRALPSLREALTG